MYIPAVKAVFIADHFGTPYAEAVPVANANTISMAAALEETGIEISRVLTAHGIDQRDQLARREISDWYLLFLEFAPFQQVCPVSAAEQAAANGRGDTLPVRIHDDVGDATLGDETVGVVKNNVLAIVGFGQRLLVNVPAGRLVEKKAV